MRYNKRAAMDVQFNWVFILVAGTIILMFFFAVIQKQKSVSEQKTGESLRVGFDGIFTSAISSSDTVFTMNVPEEGVNFECADTCDCRFHVGKGSGQFDDKLIFAPPFAPGPELTMWALDFNLPFQISTYLYVMSSQNKHVLVGDSTNENYIKAKDDLPKNLDYNERTLSDFSQFKNNNYKHTAFVFFDDACKEQYVIDDSFKSDSVSGVCISGKGENRKITFYKKFKNSKSLRKDVKSKVLLAPNDASFFGAIFSGDYQIYNCNYRKTVRRLATISDIYNARTTKLKQMSTDGQVPARCIYENANSAFGELKNWAKTEYQSTLNTANQQNSNSGAQLNTILMKLKKENNFLVQESCPLLY